jgi:acyl carrier protein
MRIVDIEGMLMDMASIVEQARDVLASALGMDAEDIPDSASTASLSRWDSLHHVALIAALEDHFNVMYTSEEIPLMVTLQDIAHVTARHVEVLSFS